MKTIDRLIASITRRPPDFVIGGTGRPYLLRWWLTPWSGCYRDVEQPNLWQQIVRRLPAIYLHNFLRSDDDRALHDHPWANVSILLRGAYTEHTIAAGGVHRREVLSAGALRVRWTGRIAHRVELHDGPSWSLFITGPRYRSWGFHCPEQGWIDWKRFTAADDPGSIGKGCDA
jgi:hypothetical protein